MANSARIVISLAILFSNPLGFYVAISIIFPSMVAPRVDQKWHLLAEYAVRFSIITFCCKFLYNFFSSLANSARVVISLAILFSNPLQFYVAVSIIFPEIIAPRVNRKWHVLSEYLLRYAIILFCCKYRSQSNKINLV